MRLCKVCSVEKDISEFREYVGPNKKKYFLWTCLVCEREVKAAYYRNKRLDLNWRLADRVKRYGISVEQYKQMFEEQEGKCYICKNDMGVPRIDHNHKCCAGGNSCGKCVRALLCARCNNLLGMALDDAELLRTAAGFVEKFS